MKYGIRISPPEQTPQAHFIKFLWGLGTLLDGLVCVISFGFLYSQFGMKAAASLARYRMKVRDQ